MDETGLSVRDAVLNASTALLKKDAPKLSPCFKTYIPIDAHIVDAKFVWLLRAYFVCFEL